MQEKILLEGKILGRRFGEKFFSDGGSYLYQVS